MTRTKRNTVMQCELDQMQARNLRSKGNGGPRMLTLRMKLRLKRFRPTLYLLRKFLTAISPYSFHTTVYIMYAVPSTSLNASIGNWSQLLHNNLIIPWAGVRCSARMSTHCMTMTESDKWSTKNTILTKMKLTCYCNRHIARNVIRGHYISRF